MTSIFSSVLIKKRVHLQLATSQYGDESSTPQPRILTAMKRKTDEHIWGSLAKILTVSTKHLTRGVFVDTCFVGKEVSVDWESSFDGTILVDFSLDFYLIWTNSINAGTIVFVLGKWGWVLVNTFSGAFWCWLFTLALWFFFKFRSEYWEFG